MTIAVDLGCKATKQTNKTNKNEHAGAEASSSSVSLPPGNCLSARIPHTGSPGVHFMGVDCQELLLMTVVLCSFWPPGPHMPTTCILLAVLAVLLERCTCPCHEGFSRSSSSRFASSSHDLTVAMSYMC